MMGKTIRKDTKRIIMLALVAGMVLVATQDSVVAAANPEKPAMKASIKIEYDKKTGGISPLIYGSGFEHVAGAVNLGLHAQMLDGRSFEEDDINRDGVSDKWLQVNWGERITLIRSREGGGAFHGDYAQLISIPASADRTGESGIKQVGMSIVKGKKYIASVYLRQGGRRSPVRVYLGKGRKIYAGKTIENLSSEWKKYAVELVPDVSTNDAEFGITLTGKATMWIDQVSLIPEDTYKGHNTRKDIMEKVLELGPTFIRWPGGWVSEVYRWKDGIGDVDKRPLLRKYYSNCRRKNNPQWESNSFGTDEFMQFCRDIGAEPILAVDIGYEKGADVKKRIKEAAEWVEYCNGDSNSPFGAKRKANGHAEPYGVRYWCIGNESWDMKPEEYGRLFIRFAKAMKKKDPQIKLIAVGGETVREDRHNGWNLPVIKTAGAYMDYIDLHLYYGNSNSLGTVINYFETMAEPLKYEDFLIDLGKQIPILSPGSKAKPAILEWNSNHNWPDASQLKQGLFAAGFLNVLERQANIVELAGAWPLLRRVQIPGNYASDHGLIWFDNHRIFLYPTALAFKLYRQNYAAEMVLSSVESETFDVRNKSNIPYLDVVATRDREKNLLILKVVNKSLEREISASIDLEGASSEKVGSEVAVSVLTGSDIEVRNSIEHPDEVRIVESVFKDASKSFVYSFAPHSVTVLRIKLSSD